MKNLLKKVTVSSLLVISTSIFSMQGLSVITITTDDPEGYVEWLTKNSSVFQEAAGDDVSSSGICSPIAGGREMNEHYVWSFHPSTSAMVSNRQFSNEDAQKAISKISSKRDLVRRDMWSVMKGDAVGEAGTTNANYNVMSETDDANAYLAGITALEKAANDNGFAVSFAFYSATAAGDRAGMVMVSVQAETANELGRFLDQRQSSWMAEALSGFDVVRNPVEDFLMNCSTISVNN
jgi:hypothetical protein|tara:strand:- start:88 stop:795 length:708 start_codon:yes stop_codon:yes gene_type:complete